MVALQAAEKLVGTVILRSRRRRRISHCLENTQSEILRSAQDDSLRGFSAACLAPEVVQLQGLKARSTLCPGAAGLKWLRQFYIATHARWRKKNAFMPFLGSGFLTPCRRSFLVLLLIPMSVVTGYILAPLRGWHPLALFRRGVPWAANKVVRF